jgi:putative membrane protein
MLPLIFSLIHGSLVYRFRGILIFTLFCIVAGNALENLSIVTGFPFGRYHFTDVMGPKLFQVPILLGLAYVGMGYLSWTIGRLILGDIQAPSVYHVVTQPLVAALIMVAWDLSMDPIWSNLVHGWIWHDGGAYFGVPVSNFLGWFLTNYLIYQSFSLYLRREPTNPRPLPATFWRMAVLMYAVSAAGNLFVMPPPGLSVVTDAAGTRWRVEDIFRASMVISICIMGGFAVVAWQRIKHTEKGNWPPMNTGKRR